MIEQKTLRVKCHNIAKYKKEALEEHEKWKIRYGISNRSRRFPRQVFKHIDM